MSGYAPATRSSRSMSRASIRRSPSSHRLHGLDVIYKVGHEALFGYGEAILRALGEAGAQIFVDAKLHDIPRTVAAGVRALVRPGVRIINVHALGGGEMMAAAVQAAHERARELGIAAPQIFAVTILTSISAADLGELGLAGGAGENVIRLAALARDARCAGRRVQRARGRRSEGILRLGVRRALPRDSPGRGGARRSEARRDAAPMRRAPARTTSSSGGRSRRPPIRAPRPSGFCDETLQAQYGR